MKRSNRPVLLVGAFFAVALVAIGILMYEPVLKVFTTYHQERVLLLDGRTVQCVRSGAAISCDWDHAK
jgi:hypothetical protein